MKRVTLRNVFALVTRRPRAARFFPCTSLYLVTGTELAPREFFEDARPVALAGSFTPDLSGDHRHRADDLRLACKPVRIEFVGRPGKVLVHPVEAEPEKMLTRTSDRHGGYARIRTDTEAGKSVLIGKCEGANRA